MDSIYRTPLLDCFRRGEVAPRAVELRRHRAGLPFVIAAGGPAALANHDGLVRKVPVQFFKLSPQPRRGAGEAFFKLVLARAQPVHGVGVDREYIVTLVERRRVLCLAVGVRHVRPEARGVQFLAVFDQLTVAGHHVRAFFGRLVADRAENDRRMIHIALNHLFYKTLSCRCIIEFLPACQLIQHK